MLSKRTYLSGKYKLATVGQLRDLLAEVEHLPDLTRVTLMPSIGFGTSEKAAEELRDQFAVTFTIEDDD